MQIRWNQSLFFKIILVVNLVQLEAMEQQFFKNDQRLMRIKEDCRRLSKVTPNVALTVLRGSFEGHDRNAMCFVQCILEKSNMAGSEQPSQQRLKQTVNLQQDISDDQIRSCWMEARMKRNQCADSYEFCKCLYKIGNTQEHGDPKGTNENVAGNVTNPAGGDNSKNVTTQPGDKVDEAKISKGPKTDSKDDPTPKPDSKDDSKTDTSSKTAPKDDSKDDKTKKTADNSKPNPKEGEDPKDTQEGDASPKASDDPSNPEGGTSPKTADPMKPVKVEEGKIPDEANQKGNEPSKEGAKKSEILLKIQETAGATRKRRGVVNGQDAKIKNSLGSETRQKAEKKVLPAPKK